MYVGAAVWVARGSIGGIVLGLLLPLRNLFDVNSRTTKKGEGIKTRTGNIEL